MIIQPHTKRSPNGKRRLLLPECAVERLTARRDLICISPKISCSPPNEGPCAILAMPASNYSGHSTASESQGYPRTPMRRARPSARIWPKTPMADNPISVSRPPNSATPKR